MPDVFAQMPRPGSIHRPLTGLEISSISSMPRQDPAMRNADVAVAVANEDFQTELGQFNIEITFVRAAWPARRWRNWKRSYGQALRRTASHRDE